MAQIAPGANATSHYGIDGIYNEVVGSWAKKRFDKRDVVWYYSLVLGRSSLT